MKKTIVLTLIIISIFSLTVFSASRTIYQGEEPTQINTSIGFGTELVFDIEIQEAWTPNQNYDINYNEGMTKLIITPQKRGIKTNLNVTDKNGNEYVFILNEIESDNFSDIDLKVRVKPKEKIDYKEIINIMKEEKVSNQSLKDMIQIYEIDSEHRTVNNFKFDLLKVSLFDNIEQTIYWLRATNLSERNKVINSIGINERKIESLAIEGDRNKIRPDNYIDFFLFLKESKTNKKLTFNIRSDGEDYNFDYEPINYKRKMFQIFDYGN